MNLGRDLRNSIDFRLRVEDVTTSITDSPFLFKSRNYYKQPRIKPDTVFTTDFDEYQGVVHSVSIDKKAKIHIKPGVPAVFIPLRLEEVKDAMTLGYFTVPGGFGYPEIEINFETVEKKRYTLREIGRSEDRVNRIKDS